jgi:hypothetical protein
VKNLTKAIYSKASGTRFSTLVGGRFFEDMAPAKAQYPYVVYSVVSSVKDKTFTETFRNTMVQFSIYSSKQDSIEIKDIYEQLSNLYDECYLSGMDGKFLRMYEENVVTTIEDGATTQEGTTTVRHWAVDFEILTET